MFNGFKMFSFRCRSHVKEMNMPKNMFGYPLKLILGFFAFLALNYNIHKQLYMIVKNHHERMNYLKLDYSIFLT
jgi:hypothetical protein